jgi:hypothetical protein
MWKKILSQLNASIFNNWRWLLALVVGIVVGAANCGGVGDVVVKVLPDDVVEADAVEVEQPPAEQ